MVPHFIPRPILAIKPYEYQVRAGDKATAIAARHGAGPGGYRELLAANLPRATSALGSLPAMTFADLREGERLKIPFHWQDPPEVLRALGDAYDAKVPVLDVTNPIFVAAKAATDKAGITDQRELAAVLNAVVQWYVNLRDTTKPIDAPLMDALVGSATAWYTTIGQGRLPVDTNGVDPAAVFPWAPFALLFGQATLPYDQIQWTAPIPGETLTWFDFPWDLVAQAGVSLETSPIIVGIDGTQVVDKGTLRSAVQTALSLSTSKLPAHASCGTDLYDASLGMCVNVQTKVKYQPTCDKGNVWDAAHGLCAMISTPNPMPPQGAKCPSDLPDYANGQCVDLAAPSKGGTDPSCPTGQVWDANSETCVMALIDCADGFVHKDGDPTKPCVPICKDPTMTWDSKDKACVCPAGKVVDPASSMCIVHPEVAAAAAADEKKKYIVPVVAAVGVGGLLYWWYRASKKKRASESEED